MFRPRELRRPGAAQRTRREESGDFSASDILDVIAAARSDIGIVTLAPELPGGLELIRTLVSAGHRVSLGHSGASIDEALAAIELGARQATHLFNGMAQMTHRSPGVAGAVLARDEVAAELICDGYHVHPAMSRMAIRSKGVGRIMAITDGTSGSGLNVGAHASLGGRRIHVTDHAAVLDEGTLAGSTLTMDRAFKTIVTVFGFTVLEAATVCSTTPARVLGLSEFGVLAEVPTRTSWFWIAASVSSAPSLVDVRSTREMVRRCDDALHLDPRRTSQSRTSHITVSNRA